MSVDPERESQERKPLPINSGRLRLHAEGIQAHKVRGPRVAVTSMLIESNIAVVVVNSIMNFRPAFIFKTEKVIGRNIKVYSKSCNICCSGFI